jgi:uncharacterized membrane protein
MTQKHTKTEFIKALGDELARLRVADSDDIISDFEQHFASGLADGQSEAAICGDLGDPRDIALQYANVDLDAVPLHADTSTADLEVSRQALKKSIKLGLKKELRDELTHELTLEDVPVDSVTPAMPDMPVLPEMPAMPSFGEPATAEKTIHTDTAAAQNGAAFSSQQAQATQNTQNGGYQYEYRYNYQYGTGNNTNGQQSAAEYTEYRGNNRGSYPGYSEGIDLNISKLVLWLLLDVFVFSWALPAMLSIFASVIVSLGAILLSSVVMVVASVFEMVFDSTGEGLAVLFSGMFGLGFSGLLFPLSLKLIGVSIRVIKFIINCHSEAFIGKPIFKPKGVRA